MANSMTDKTMFSLVSLGCDKNLVDSEVMVGVLRARGFESTNELERAELIILNTCGFLESAVDEGFQTALGLLEYKKKNCKAFIMTGCMATRYKDEIFETLEGVDAIVGAADYDRIANIALEALGGKKKTAQIADINRNVPDDARQKRVHSTGHYAYLKISEGCDKHCTYCAIPLIRGRYRSRPFEALITEAEALAENGVKELILVAQDTTHYGCDLKDKPTLASLINRLSRIEKIRWVRVLYLYPEGITDELIAEFKANTKLCRYIDMPIQHANDDVLKRMGRQTSKAEITVVLEKLRAELPDVAIRTTLIAGFPGETPRQFKELKEFILEQKFDRLGAFAYSKEQSTPAALLTDQIGSKERSRRADELMELQSQVSAALNEGKLGAELELIIDGRLEGEENIYVARSQYEAPAVDGLVFVESDETLEAGSFVNAVVTGFEEYDLFAEIV